MIRRVSGEIAEIVEDSVVVRTGAGLCYEVLVGAYALPELRALMGAREPVELYTHHYLEGNVAAGQLVPRLAGFLTPAERELYLSFIKVQGLSARSAIRALILPPERIAGAIVAEDISLLTKLPGVGNKKAEQIVSKLKDELAGFALAAETPGEKAPPPKSAAQRAEAMGVLVGRLGYRTPEAEDLIERALAALGEATDTEAILNEVFRLGR